MIHHLKQNLPVGEYHANGRQCYSTGKVVIGLLHTPKPRDIGSEAERVQRALLNHAKSQASQAA